MFDQLENFVDLNQGPITISWTAKDVGWGQFTFTQQDDQIYCSNEGMSKDFIKKVLCDMIDNCILTD